MSTCEAAAAGGHLEVLQWAWNHGCPRDAGTCAAAALGGQLEMLMWARQNGCPLSSSPQHYMGGMAATLHYLRNTCHSAAKGGHLEVLKWARKKNCPWDADTSANAAEGGNLEMLQWMRERNCPFGTDICASAARGGHMEVLQWLRERGYEWGEYTFAYAAWSGHLEVLKWLRAQGFFWDGAVVCRNVARGGHLEVLKWIAQHSEWQWSDTGPRCLAIACAEAADAAGQVEVALWARSEEARAATSAHIENFKADLTEDKKTMTAVDLKIILLAFNIVIPPGTRKAGLVRLIIDNNLAA